MKRLAESSCQVPGDQARGQEGDHQSDAEGECERVAVGTFDVDELVAAHREVGLEQVVVEDGRSDDHCQDRDGERTGEQHDELADHQARGQAGARPDRSNR